MNAVIDFLNQNSGAVTAIATVSLLLVTGWYAFTTWALLREAKQSRLLAGEPRVVAYLRVHEVHPTIVQLWISNLSGAPAIGVSAIMEKTTGWPATFDLHDSTILRDLSFVRPQEVLKFDLGFGPDLFSDDQGAIFEITIRFSSLDGRTFTFSNVLKVESVVGPSWKIYGIDDVARSLKDISGTLKDIAGSRRLKVETYDANDRKKEVEAREKLREQQRNKSGAGGSTGQSEQ